VNQQQQQQLYQLLGENVRRYRNQSGFTQEQLADRIDLTRTSVVNIEQGRQHPPLHLLIQIAKTLKVSIQALIPDESEFMGDNVLDENTLKDVSDKDKPKLTSFLTDHLNTPNSHD
jgi:DNA-binding XRE family transcriptional regulator